MKKGYPSTTDRNLKTNLNYMQPAQTTQPQKYDRVSLLSIVILIVLTWGFYRTYIVFFPSFEGFQFAQHFHGAIMLLWMAILIVQPWLISRNKFMIHRAIGKATLVLAPILWLLFSWYQE